MGYYKATTVLKLTSSLTGSLANTWGILPGSSAAGVLTLQPATLGGTTFPTMSIADLAVGIPFVCNPRSVTVTAGTVYLLA